MGDREIMENLLLNLKGECDLLMHGAIESSTPAVHSAFTSAFSETLALQNEVYNKMAAKGWLLDEMTNRLDLESITAVNEGLMNFKGTLLFDSHDHQFVQTIADRIIEILPGGIIDRQMTYDEYIDDENIDALREKMSV